MKFICLLRCTNILAAIFVIGYASLVFGNDRIIGDQYTVIINGVPFQDDVASSILIRLDCQKKKERGGVVVFDNIKGKSVSLSELAYMKINDDMNLKIEGSELVSKLSEIYNKRYVSHDDQNTEDKECVSHRVEFSDKVLMKIRMCIDGDGKVYHFYYIIK